MVVCKHRYLIVKIASQEKQNLSTVLINFLNENMRKNFGDFIISKLTKLELCEYHENMNVAIIKCNLEIYKYLAYTIVTANLSNTRISIISVSGILKKAKIELLKKNKSKIV